MHTAFSNTEIMHSCHCSAELMVTHMRHVFLVTGNGNSFLMYSGNLNLIAKKRVFLWITGRKIGCHRSTVNVYSSTEILVEFV